jgi:hypothetical protein
MQRSGTTSVGRFFRDFGFRVAGWPADARNKWSEAWVDGKHERIFSSSDFRASNAFEDSPWFFPGLYQELHSRFPDARFVLFTRDEDAWFRSMLSHSGGNVIGNTRVHCRIYDREQEYADLVQSEGFSPEREHGLFSEKTLKLEGLDDHYKKIYLSHNRAAADFFSKFAPEALFVGKLEDRDKWKKLGEFLNLDVPDDYNVHENRSRS